MALKVKFRTQFPANVSVTAPITMTKTGLSYVFGFNPTGVSISGALITGSTISSSTITVADNAFTLQDDIDATKQGRFQLSGITTGTLRTYTLPDASDTLAGIGANQTFQNKTIDTASGNTLKVNGTSLTTVTGTGAVVLANTPSLVTPAIGVATATSLAINGATIGANGVAVAGSSAFTGAMIVSSTSASALTVGAGGGLNPALQVDASSASSATGIKVTSFAAGSGSAITTVSSGTNENLAINAKGSGQIGIGNSSTGPVSIGQSLIYGGVTLTNAVTGTGSMVLSTAPTLTLPNATGLPISTGVSGLGTNVATFLATASSANLAAALTDETGTGAAVFGTSPTVTTPNIVGTTAVGNASAGSVAEYVPSVIASGSAVALTTGVGANMTSISLTAGDWDVWYIPNFTPGATTNITQLFASINTVSATTTLAGDSCSFTSYGSGGVVPGAVGCGAPMIQKRINVSSTTTVFAVAQCTFTVSTLGAWGSLQARRVR